MKKIITIIMISIWMGCLLCYAENQNDQLLPLFKETQQATVFYLDNGMEVILVENHANPMIAAVTVVKSGSRNEDAASNGSAHFLEHLLFNGTKTHAGNKIKLLCCCTSSIVFKKTESLIIVFFFAV